MAKADLSIKLAPKSRAQRRELDRAAASAGLKTGPWCLSVALAAARAVLAPQGASAAPKPAPAGVRLTEAGALERTGGAVHVRSTLTRSYDPDGTP